MHVREMEDAEDSEQRQQQGRNAGETQEIEIADSNLIESFPAAECSRGDEET